MSNYGRVSDFGGQLTPQTVNDANDTQRAIQYRFNNQAHIPPMTGAASGNYTGDVPVFGEAHTYNVRQLNAQRGLSPTITGKNAMTVATGMCPDCGCGCNGGSRSTIKGQKLNKNYGMSDRAKNITGMDPKMLGVSNDMLYAPPIPLITSGSEDARILKSELEKPTSLADRITRVGGTVR